MYRSLLYHIYPYGDINALYENLTHVTTCANKFDHIRFKVIIDPTRNDADDLYPFFTALENKKIEYNVTHYLNDPSLGEVVGFIKELSIILHESPQGITYIGTTAGVSRTGNSVPNIAAWVRSIYFLLLHNIPRIEQKFIDGATSVGVFKKTTPMSKGGPRPAPWHYSGAQFWLSNAALLANPNWKDVAMCRHGVEMYPGYMLPIETAVSIYDTDLDLYDNKLHPRDWISQL